MNATFRSTEQAVNVLWHFMPRLAALLVWTMLGTAHLAVMCLALGLAWWTQTTPAQVASTALHMLQSWPVAALAAVGVSALTLAALYWRLLSWAHRLAGGGVLSYLMRGL